MSCNFVACVSLCFCTMSTILNTLSSISIQQIGLVAENNFYATNLIGSYINIFYSVGCLFHKTLLSPLSCIFIGVLVVCWRMMQQTPKNWASAVSVRHAVYKIILDCGCTFNMSGDLGLFIESSMSPINEHVGLAGTDVSSKATHRGKMIVDGKILDALYVPDFKQTMISMGQLEKMGLVYTKVSENARSFLTDKGDVFMSFYIAPNNLYPLLPTSQSSSAGTAEDSN